MIFIRTILKIATLVLLLGSSLFAAEGDFTNFNIKAASEYNSSSVMDDTAAFVELEAIIKRGNFNFYGFSDFRYKKGEGNHDSENINMDFYKYNFNYDVAPDRKLFFSMELKETGRDFAGDSFIGGGTSIKLPIIGRIVATAYYFTGDSDSNDRSANPYALQFTWSNHWFDLGKGWSVSHTGWSDIDFFNELEDNENTATSIQVYEAISFNYKNAYSLETGYKYWMNTYGIANEDSHSVYVYFIKRF